MPEQTDTAADGAPDAPAHRYGGEIVRTWQQAVYRAISRRLTQGITACAQAAELISGAAPGCAADEPGTTQRPLSWISQAGQALDAAHELACKAADPDESWSAACGKQTGVFASSGTDGKYRQRRPGPATGQLRTEIRDPGHRPVPAWWPRTRAATVSGRHRLGPPRPAGAVMPVIRIAGTARHSDTISPAALALARVITTAAPPWAAQALCAQTDPDLFFSDSASQTAQAKATCRRCPVRDACLDCALETSEDFGVWGGLDRDERRRLLRRRRDARPSTGAA